MTSFVVTPIKKIRSCPNLRLGSKPFNDTLKKELVVGSAMAVATILISGQHHHLTTFKELESTLTYETINTISMLQYDKKSLLSRLCKRRKKLALFIIIVPFLIRYISYIGIELLV